METIQTSKNEKILNFRFAHYPWVIINLASFDSPRGVNCGSKIC